MILSRHLLACAAAALASSSLYKSLVPRCSGSASLHEVQLVLFCFFWLPLLELVLMLALVLRAAFVFASCLGVCQSSVLSASGPPSFACCCRC